MSIGFQRGGTLDLTLGLDIGTSACKAVLVDHNGTVVRVGRGLVAEQACGRATEERSESWWEAALAALRSVLKDLPKGSLVRAIGLSGQIGTHVPIGHDDRPLSDSVTWRDNRSARMNAELHQRVEGSLLRSETGVELPDGAAWPLPRLLWLRAERQRELEAAKLLVQPKDYVGFKLTNEWGTDASSWRGLVHPNGQVAKGVLDALELPDLVPPVLGPAQLLGHLKSGVAAELGLVSRVPVIVGWNDLNCALVGCGPLEDDEGFDVAGTSEHLGILLGYASKVSPPLMEIESRTGDEVLRLLYGVTSNSGSVLSWTRDHLVGDRNSDSWIADCSALSRSDGAGVGPLFLPYLSGERSPVWDSSARGAFVGITRSHRAHDLQRAVLEGICFNLRIILNQVEAAAGRSVARIVGSGGPARSLPLAQLKANILNRPVEVPALPDTAALGAAMIARAGVDGGSIRTAAARIVRKSITLNPEPIHVAHYEPLFTLFSELHSTLGGVNARLGSLETSN